MAWKEDLKITIGAVDKTAPGFASAREKMEGLRASAVAFNGVLTAVGLGVSMAGLIAVIKSVSDELDRVSKASQKVGVSVEGLSALEYAAGQAGVDVEALETSLTKLNKTAVEAARGGKEQAAAFEALGVEVRDSSGHLKTADKLLLELAEAFSQFEDGPAKTAVAMQLFGRSGADLIPMLNAGREGITALMEEARDLGVVMDSQAAAAAERFNDNMSRVSKSMRGLAIAASEDVLPAIAEISDAMAEAAKDSGPLKAFWVGLGGAFDQFVNGSELSKLRDHRKELEVEVGRLTKLITEGGTEIPFTPFRLIFNRETLDGYTATLSKTEAELADVTKRMEAIFNPPPKPKKAQRPEPEPSPLVEAKKAELEDLEAVAKAQEKVLTASNRDLERSINERAAIAREFKRLSDDLTNQRRPDEPVRHLDMESALRGVDTAKAQGDMDLALDRARAVAELLRSAKAQGDYFSESELAYYARRAGEAADAVMAEREARAATARTTARADLDTLLERAKGLEAIPIGLKVDSSFAEGAIKTFHQAMQKYLTDHPLTVEVLTDSRAAGGSVQDALRMAALKRGGR